MSVHIPVLMNEVLQGLDLQADDIVIDGTINGGGHALAIAKELGSDGILIGIDQDKHGLMVSTDKLKSVKPQIHLIHDNTRRHIIP